MGRLIDADKVCEYLRMRDEIYSGFEVADLLDEQPTAFDKEKVLGELNEKRKIPCIGKGKYGDEVYREVVDYYDVISIVQKGGVK